MDVQIDESWKKVLNEEFEKDYFKYLTTFIKYEYRFKSVYPPADLLFNAFNLCPFEDQPDGRKGVRVVILGQDPYHGKGEAHGLSFSVQDGVRIPPSLKNIYKEIEDDIGITQPASGNLERWAKQGVLLLNASLTVLENQPASHQNKGWEEFTDHVIKTISDKKEHIVFILWGAFAGKKEYLIDSTKHLILRSAHPSPYSAANFFGNHHFSKTNKYLKEHGLKPISW